MAEEENERERETDQQGMRARRGDTRHATPRRHTLRAMKLESQRANALERDGIQGQALPPISREPTSPHLNLTSNANQQPQTQTDRY